MSDAAEMSERHARLLARLGERGVELACEAFDRAMAADDPQVAALYMGAFHRLSRSARQSMALEARLQRDHVRAEREDAIAARKQARRQIVQRKAQVRAAVERLIWTEAEGEDADILIGDLDARLDQEALDPTFDAEPLEAHIARLCKELGLADPPPMGEVAPQATEGAETHSHINRPVSQPPQPLRGSSPSGGASGSFPDHPFQSSA